MKLVLAIIQPTKLVAVREALEKIAVTRMTIGDVQDYVNLDQEDEFLDGPGRRPPLLRKVVLEIFVNDDFLERTLEVIANVARTDDIGDGSIFVMPAAEAIRINDRVKGPEAV